MRVGHNFLVNKYRDRDSIYILYINMNIFQYVICFCMSIVVVYICLYILVFCNICVFGCTVRRTCQSLCKLGISLFFP